MRLRLKLEKLKDAPRTKFGLPALGWATQNAEAGTIHVVRGAHIFLWARGRKVHEAEHLLNGLGNEMHDGHDWHFCARSWHWFRFLWNRHACPGALVAGFRLKEDGDELDNITAEGLKYA